MGNELNLESDKIEILKIGAMFHDVGKISISDNILVKNTALTNYEFEIMKRHVTIGEALFSIHGYDEIKKIIRSHHE